MTSETVFAPDGLGDGPGPRYLALRRRIETAMAAGRLLPGDPLPPEREIARLTGTSRVTVRKAIEDLVLTGRVVQRRGSGSFVGSAEAQAVSGPGGAVARLASLGEELALRGIAATAEVTAAGLFAPSPGEIEALGLSPAEQVLRIERLRRAGGTPIGIERTILPPGILPRPKKAAALYAALGEAGHRPVRAVQRIGAAALTKKDAKALGVAKGAAALALRRAGYLASGRVVEITEALYLAGTLDIVAELRGG